MKLKEKFDSIDQSKLNADQKDFLSKIEKATKNFTSDNKEVNDKVEGALDKMIATFKEKMPEAIKTKAEKKEPKSSAKKATSKSSEKPSRTSNGKRSVMSVAKEIRKDGESWADAQKRARAEMKKDKESATKEVKTEMDKLLAFIKTRKELEGIHGTDLKRDSSREAKPRGRRISKDGNVYYENRENRIDRLAPNYPKDAPMLENGGQVVKPHYYVIALEKRHNLQYGDSKRFATESEAITWGEKQFIREDVGEVVVDRIRPNDKGGVKIDTVYRINNDYPLGERVVMNPVTYLKGGMLSPRERYNLEIKGMTGVSVGAIEKYIYENNLNDNDVLNIVVGLGRKQLKGADVSTAMVGKKGNAESKKLIEFVKDNKAMKLELGGNVGGYDLAGHLGGNFNVGQNDGMLDGTTGTQYSGLVGETGAMSAGEMFAEGGYLTDPNFGDFQAGVYARGGGVGDNVLGLKKGDVFQIIDEQHQASNSKYIFVDYVDKNGKIAIKAVKYPTKQGRKNIINYIFDLSNDGIKKIEVEKHEQGAYLTDPNFGDFQAGVYANGGKITKSEVMANMYKPSGDYYLEQSGNDMIVHLTSRDAGNSIVSLENKFDVKDNGKGYHGSSYILSRKKYAEGGGLGVHGLKEGDQIIKTLSGGIQKVKDKKGEIVYVNLANGERSADIPLPFNDGGEVKYFVNKDGIKVRSVAKPDKELTEKEWMAKHSESKEARTYAGGGSLEDGIKKKLNKNFSLPLEVAVYVPSTKDADESISKKEFESRIKSVEKYLSGLFGGFSANDVDGGYMSQEKGLITEEVYKVISFAQRDGFSSKMEKLVAQIKKWAKDWGQESIGLEFEGDLFYIDQAGEYKLGGMMSKHYSTRTSSHINKGNFNRSLSNRYDNGGEINAFSMRMVKGTNSEPDEVLTESQEVKFAKGGLITEEKLKEEEWFSPDGKVQFEYIQGRLRITLYYGKNRQYSTRTTINNASELSLKELNEQVKKEISHLKEFAERDLKRNFAGGGKVEKRQAYLDTLAGKESDIWDKLGAESGADIRQDKDMLRNYALKMEAMLKREEVGKGSFDEADYDHLADMNAHLMNEFLVWNNYYEPEMTVREKKWRTEKLKDPRYKIYVSDPKVITVSESSSSKNSKYIVHADIESITVKKDGKEIKIKGSDVLNGANLLKKGGDLSDSAIYYPKRSVVSVKLKNGKIVHPANGYWVIKTPKMSRTQFEEESFEYEDGGDVRSDEERVERLMNKLNEDGKLVRFIDVRGNGKKVFESIIENNGKEKTYKRYESSERGKLGVLQNSNLTESEIKHHLEKTLPKYEGGGKVSFAEKSRAIAKNFEGKRVEPKYQKEYGKTYDKSEAKEVGNKIAGAQKAKYDAKAEKGAVVKKKVGNPNAGQSMLLAKKIRKDGEKWTDAVKRASAMLKAKK